MLRAARTHAHTHTGTHVPGIPHVVHTHACLRLCPLWHAPGGAHHRAGGAGAVGAAVHTAPRVSQASLARACAHTHNTHTHTHMSVHTHTQSLTRVRTQCHCGSCWAAALHEGFVLPLYCTGLTSCHAHSSSPHPPTYTVTHTHGHTHTHTHTHTSRPCTRHSVCAGTSCG